MLTFKSRFLTRGEVWFDDEPDNERVDWIYYRQRPRPVARARRKYTVLIDLTKSPAQLMSEMDERTRQKIEVAEQRERIYWERYEACDPKIMDSIEQMWNESSQKSSPLDRPWLEKLAEANALEVSATRDPADDVLTYHLVFIGKDRAQDLIVVSPPNPVPDTALRNRINCANCLGHWKTILNLKERGFRQFDFGGWYSGTTDMRLLGMNAFKRSFGGQVVREFECEEICTAKGWLVLTTAKILRRVGFLNSTGDALAGSTTISKNNAHATSENCEVSPAI